MRGDPTTKIRDLLAEKVVQARENDFFKLLDVTEEASPQEIKLNYFRLARLVHPDSLQKASLMDRKPEAALVFEKITLAYQTLTDPVKRKAYIESRASAKSVPASSETGKVMEEAAKIALHQGKMLLNRRAWALAESHFKHYTELKPNDPRGFLFLGWCLFQNQERPLEARLEEARVCFSRALKLDEKNADAHYYMALYFKQKGALDMVEKHLKKALAINKDHVNANREMRLLRMRTGATPAQLSVGEYLKGLWEKITKKKK